jgi:competence protein ComEA
MFVGLNWNRFARDTGEPVFLHEPAGVWVLLGEGFSDVGLARQFGDDCRLKSVIQLTKYGFATDIQKIVLDNPRIESGRRIDLIVQETEIQSISFSWMTAGQRVALGIPLHPDRMTLNDWEFLPGVGAKTAVKIEQNRQVNGDFGNFEGLRRIKGVGSSKMAIWRNFFKENVNL